MWKIFMKIFLDYTLYLISTKVIHCEGFIFTKHVRLRLQICNKTVILRPLLENIASILQT